MLRRPPMTASLAHDLAMANGLDADGNRQKKQKKDFDPLDYAVIPGETRRDHLGKPFDVTQAVKRRPTAYELAPLDPSDSTRAGLIYMDHWATTYLREDAGCPPASFVYSQEARARKWDLLRHLHGVVYGEPRYRHVSIENTMWAAAGPDGAVAQDVYVACLVGAYKFDRKLRMESRLKRLYKCFEGAEVNKADYRETVVGLRILEDSKQIPARSRELLLSYYDLFGDDETGAVTRASALKLVGVAAESERDVQNTRGKLVWALNRVLPRHGLKSESTHIPRDAFMECLEVAPQILDTFKETMWNRCKDDQRLDYLAEQEDKSDKRFSYLDNKMKMAKAVKMFQGSFLRKIWNQWHRYYLHYHEMNNKRLYMMYRRTRKMVLFWDAWTKERREQQQRRRVARVMGRLHVERRLFSRWRRWVTNMHKIVFATRRFTPYWRQVSEGFAALRFAWRLGSLRLALGDWREETVFSANWEYAIKYNIMYTRRVHIRAWRKHVIFKNADYKRAAEARKQQQMLRDMMADFEKMDKERAEAEAAAAEKAAADAHAKKAAEKRYRIYWSQQRKKAEKHMDDKYIRENQLEFQRNKGQEKRRKLREDFEEKWRVLEIEMADNARQRKREWLKDREVSKEVFEKKYDELRKQFFEPPTQDNQERERQLNSLANVVVIEIESHLFRKGRLLSDFISDFDLDGNGYLSHDEFIELMKQIEGLNLSMEQIRNVIKEIDEDDDGMITIEEFEAQAELVEKYLGQLGSPWKTYVDPVQGVLCYHNMQTREKVFDFQMRKFDRIDPMRGFVTRNRKLEEICSANFIGEAEYEARLQAHRDRDKDWTATLENAAARTMQKMYWVWFQRQQFEKVRWKAKKKFREAERDIERWCVRKLAAHYRGRNTRRYLRPWIAKCFCKKRDKVTGRIYYQQVYSMEEYDHRPHMHRRYFPNIEW